MAQVQRMSRLMVKTLRDDPADAETLSHKLLVRAGYVRRTAAGIWTWLPLGKKVLDNVSRVVREEMDAIGAQEVLLPALLPKEPYEATGRWEEYGDLLFRLKDRKGGDYLLGPTHEEIFTQIVKDQCTSYKDLPVILYQIQTKYRDEARPRSGVLRGREFQMKDSYSFDTDGRGPRRVLRACTARPTSRIFERLGLDYRIVSAVSGAMGGSASEEFLAPAAAGEDTFVDCPHCDYAANTEAVTFTRSRRWTPPAHGARRGAGHPRHPDHRDPRRAPRRARLRDPEEPAGEGRRRDRRRRRARRPRGGPRQARASTWRPPWSSWSPPRTSTDRPDLVRGYVGPQGLGEGPLHRRPAGRARHRLDHRRQQGRQARAQRRRGPRLRGRRLPRRRRRRGGRPLPDVRHRPEAGPRHRDRPHLPAGPQVRRRLPARRARPARQAGPRHHGLVRHRRLPRGGRPRRADRRRQGPVLARARSPRPTCTSSPRARRSRPNWPWTSPRSCGAAGLRVLVDDRAGVSPGVKFTDSELIGVPQILVAGRRAGRRRPGAQGPPHRRARGAHRRRGDRAAGRLSHRS